jgi:aspartyl aminopeptidase
VDFSTHGSIVISVFRDVFWSVLPVGLLLEADDHNTIEQRLVKIDRALLRISNLVIHLQIGMSARQTRLVGLPPLQKPVLQ